MVTWSLPVWLFTRIIIALVSWKSGREGTVGGAHMITSCLALQQNNYCSYQVEEGWTGDSRRWAYDHLLSGSLPESLLLLLVERVWVCHLGGEVENTGQLYGNCFRKIQIVTSVQLWEPWRRRRLGSSTPSSPTWRRSSRPKVSQTVEDGKEKAIKGLGTYNFLVL